MTKSITRICLCVFVGTLLGTLRTHHVISVAVDAALVALAALLIAVATWDGKH